ncbi:DUF3017 domain-containing protein [Streptomyces sp. CAI-24]|uniref:DUF3017 domain-containing protein n=1 Tax=Streptomyces sp. CAI-24 TaxID=2712892 RepID=UPI001586EEEA|nr:DUF3017 domain-containing protein [Streptomyces sp. CAI-24]NUV40536.1 DUF3017 domain-containing protein [Streptomyces sp. CAI-24]
MGAGTSPADPAPAGDRAVGGPESGDVEGGNTAAGNGRSGDGAPGDGAPGAASSGSAGPGSPGPGGATSGDAERGGPESGSAESGDAERAGSEAGSARSGGGEPRSAESGKGEPADADPAGPAAAPRKSRRFPLFTRDTARPEGGGRAASGDAPAPARQWPLLSVISAAGIGLLIVALDPFAEAFRIGIILIGAALIAGAVLRWAVPSVGMLAVRSRFTDLVTYGLMGTLIVLLALVAQPKPWLDVPILEDAVRFTIR